ncbi:MAG: hypothetical protein QM752_01745 [Gammaproteobacteria bacterium]
MKLHKNVSTLSFVHRYQICAVFKQILGIHDIEHFSLDLVRPDEEMLFLSGTPSHGYEICKRGYAQYDGIISPEYYQKHEFYWWKNACHKKYADKIAEIREGVLNLKYGFMLVRKWNDFYLIYSFATKRHNLDFQSKVVNNINELLRMGDFAYMELRNIYAEYCGDFTPPVIDTFYAFQGGEPPARYSKDYQLQNAIYKPESNIIHVDFKNKIKYPFSTS